MSFESLMLSLGPTAGYRLGEPVGTTGADSVLDASENSYHGTPTSVTFGATGSIFGDADTAATFSEGSYIDVSDSGVLSLPTSGAFSIVVRCNPAASMSEGRACEFSGTGAFYLYPCDNTAAGGVRIRWNGSNVLIQAATLAGDWHTYVVTWDGTYLRLYLDGVLAKTSSDLTATVAGIGPYTNFRIGDTAGLAADLDEVWLYPTTLTLANIEDIHDYAENGPPASPPAAPSGLTASASGDTVTIEFTDNSDDETGFLVQVSDNEVDWSDFATLSSGTTYEQQSGFTSGTYYFRVRAYNDDGDSDWSNTASVVVSVPSISAGNDQTGVRAASASISATVENATFTGWSVVSGGTGTFGNASSADTTFTADAAGTYVLQANGSDDVSDTVSVEFVQALSSISPASATVQIDGTRTFTALDQFSDAIESGITWSETTADAGSGSINSSTGVYTAPSAPTTDTVQASDGTDTDTAGVTVVDELPTSNSSQFVCVVCGASHLVTPL